MKAKKEESEASLLLTLERKTRRTKKKKKEEIYIYLSLLFSFSSRDYVIRTSRRNDSEDFVSSSKFLLTKLCSDAKPLKTEKKNRLHD